MLAFRQKLSRRYHQFGFVPAVPISDFALTFEGRGRHESSAGDAEDRMGCRVEGLRPKPKRAAPQGFEPRYADPESAVLPLNEGAVFRLEEPAQQALPDSMGRRQVWLTFELYGSSPP